jgi:hypothetical protein
MGHMGKKENARLPSEVVIARLLVSNHQDEPVAGRSRYSEILEAAKE